MVVIFAAFKKEAADLLKQLKLKKIIKNKSALIYDGVLKNKRIIICITGMGKSNALFAVSLIIKMNLDNPLFIIQGISGGLTDNLNIGDLVFYETIKNLEKFQITGNMIETESHISVAQKQNPAYANVLKNTEVININEDTLCLPYGKRLTGINKNEYKLSGTDEIKAAFEIIDENFDLIKNNWETRGKDLRIFKVSGGLVSNVITDRTEKDTLNKIYGVEAIDMESYYIADNAINNEIPVICIRSISDSPFEPIPELIMRFKEGSFYCRLCCLFELMFSKIKARSMLRSAKNITTSCSNLNYFVQEILLPYFGYAQNKKYLYR